MLQELFREEGCNAKLRLKEDGKPYVTDNSNYIVDLYFKTPIKDRSAAGKEISALEGVVEHGLFLDMATAVIIAGKFGVEVKTKWDIIHGGCNYKLFLFFSSQGFEILCFWFSWTCTNINWWIKWKIIGIHQVGCCSTEEVRWEVVIQPVLTPC